MSKAIQQAIEFIQQECNCFFDSHKNPKSNRIEDFHIASEYTKQVNLVKELKKLLPEPDPEPEFNGFMLGDKRIRKKVKYLLCFDDGSSPYGCRTLKDVKEDIQDICFQDKVEAVLKVEDITEKFLLPSDKR